MALRQAKYRILWLCGVEPRGRSFLKAVPGGLWDTQAPDYLLPATPSRCFLYCKALFTP